MVVTMQQGFEWILFPLVGSIFRLSTYIIVYSIYICQLTLIFNVYLLFTRYLLYYQPNDYYVECLEGGNLNNQVVTVDFHRKKTEKPTETLNVHNSGNRSRVTNDQLRGRKHLTPDEIELICRCIRKKSRYPDRDELLVLVTFHHGFRAYEVCQTKWQHVQLRSMQMKVNRIKNGISTTQPIASKRELMLLRRLHRGQK